MTAAAGGLVARKRYHDANISIANKAHNMIEQDLKKSGREGNITSKYDPKTKQISVSTEEKIKGPRNKYTLNTNVSTNVRGNVLSKVFHGKKFADKVDENNIKVRDSKAYSTISKDGKEIKRQEL